MTSKSLAIQCHIPVAAGGTHAVTAAQRSQQDVQQALLPPNTLHDNAERRTEMQQVLQPIRERETSSGSSCDGAIAYGERDIRAVHPASHQPTSADNRTASAIFAGTIFYGWLYM